MASLTECLAKGADINVLTYIKQIIISIEFERAE